MRGEGHRQARERHHVIADVQRPEEVTFTIDGLPARHLQFERKGPIRSTCEFAFRLPPETRLGTRMLQVRASGVELPPIEIEVVGLTEEDAAQAQALLQRAVALYKEIKDLALAHFSPQGEFVKDDLYVYVVSTKGVLLASGGLSSSWIGENVAGQKDAAGKPFIREMLDKAQTKGSGTVEYHWLNPATNKTEPKVAYFQKVGDRIIAVGYYASTKR